MCQHIKVYSDTESNSFLPEYAQEEINLDEDKNCWEAEWYQACEFFKGFTDVYINGVSVADLWLR